MTGISTASSSPNTRDRKGIRSFFHPLTGTPSSHTPKRMAVDRSCAATPNITSTSPCPPPTSCRTSTLPVNEALIVIGRVDVLQDVGGGHGDVDVMFGVAAHERSTAILFGVCEDGVPVSG